MKKLLVSLCIAVLLVVIVAGIAYAATGVSDPAVLRQLAQVRRATAKYHDINAALADGFIPTPHCIESPDGVMGIHYINIDRLMDPEVNILEPEILLYVESGAGLKLVGVEYWFSIGAPNTTLEDIPQPYPPAPVIFGRPLEGPMDPHEEGQGPHYDLHAWVWQGNPNGIFAQFNPNVSCE